MPPHLVSLPKAPRPAPPLPSLAFCSHCGAHPAGRRASRVCPLCEMGLLLRAHHELAPRRNDAFIVCDERLRVCAVSRGAEELLGISEPDVIHTPIGELVEGVTRDEHGDPALTGLLLEAATEALQVERTIVAPKGRREATCPARVGACGPPAAALLVLDAPLP